MKSKTEKDTMDVIELLKVLYCAPFLLYSCYTDIQTRRVSNQVWKLMLMGVALFVANDIMAGGIQALVSLLISAIIMYVFVYIIFQLGGFGGADAKSLIILSILFPVYPQIQISGTYFPLEGVPLIGLFAFSVFGNAVLLTIVVPLGMLVFNLLMLKPREILQRPAYLFVGFKTDISKLSGRHIKLIEEYSLSDGEIRTRFRRNGVKVDDEIVGKLEEYAARELIPRRVWVTPGLPFMIPITLGFFTAVFFGDLIFYLTKLLLIGG
ncbi:MAG: prepilin peptidase [ANME-2 cluster archaeon]|nr:prepilin peptidase [ANME-2 cluster archaeon]